MYAIRTNMAGNDRDGEPFAISYGDELEREALEAYGIDPDRLVETGQAVIEMTTTKPAKETATVKPAATTTVKRSRKPKA